MTPQPRWKRLAGAGAACLFLAGCSWFSQARPPADDPIAVQPDQILRPGPGPLVVGGIGATVATVAWGSVWAGESVVVYSATPDLLSALATAPTKSRAAQLSGLKPGTRYFMRVETRTPQGLARSAVCSFKTR